MFSAAVGNRGLGIGVGPGIGKGTDDDKPLIECDIGDFSFIKRRFLIGKADLEFDSYPEIQEHSRPDTYSISQMLTGD